MTSHDTVQIRITPEHVRRKTYDPVEKFFAQVSEGERTVAAYVGKVAFDLDALCDESSTPEEIPDVRDWFFEVDRRFPFIPVLLTPDEEQGQIVLYASLLVSFTPEGDSIRFDKQKLAMFAVDKIKAIQHFCREHGLDPRPSVRRFCDALNLNVGEEMEDSDSAYPFEPEKITSPFLIDFFRDGYNFHTIDASEEPVLFALVDDPLSAYDARTDVEVALFPTEFHPIITLDLTVYDIPDNPLKMSFVYNVDLERHRRELNAYAEMPYITGNFLFKQNGELFYAFTKAVDLDGEVRARLRTLSLEASNLLRAIPKPSRNFSRAVETLFRSKGTPPGGERTPSTAPAGEAPPEPADASERPVTDALQEEMALSEGSPSEALPEPADAPTLSEEARTLSDIEILQEFQVDEPEKPEENEPETADDGVLDQQRALRSPYEGPIPSHILDERIQRVTKALSKPLRKPARSVTDELAVRPDSKRVVVRDREEDPVERLSRRLVIMQNNVERVERENIRLNAEIKAAREEIDRLRQENLALENRWWKFWK